MSNVPSYRQLAERTLDQAAEALNQIPKGQVRAEEVTARAAQTQALATVAVAQALLEIGDVLRAVRAEPTVNVNVSGLDADSVRSVARSVVDDVKRRLR